MHRALVVAHPEQKTTMAARVIWIIFYQISREYNLRYFSR